jgi:hypothetical protein
MMMALKKGTSQENPLLVFNQTKKPSCWGELLFVI